MGTVVTIIKKITLYNFAFLSKNQPIKSTNFKLEIFFFSMGVYLSTFL